MPVIHYYRVPGQSEAQVLQKLQNHFPQVSNVRTESCFNVELGDNGITSTDEAKLVWLLRETFENDKFSKQTFLTAKDNTLIIEVGPRLAFSTAYSSNSLSMFNACGINGIVRVEQSRRYLISFSAALESKSLGHLTSLLYDRMTECVYLQPLESFDNDVHPAPSTVIPLLEEGVSALEKVNKTEGLGFDAWDINFYYDMFVNVLKRNPTDVECFDLGQSNSEHSRHWFFGGKMVFDGVEKEGTLFSMVKATLKSPSNSIIAFHDNSSVSFIFLFCAI